MGCSLVGQRQVDGTMSELEQVVAAVTSSKKYRTVCADTVRRIAEREVANQGNEKAAIKATKRRLHQVYGAFEQAIDYDALYRRMEVAYRSGSEDRIRAACRQILDLHSSTRERLPILERFYPAIFEATGRPDSILDLGCGLNPVSLPWMGLNAASRYIALDIDRERIRFLRRFLCLAGLDPLTRCQDILVQPPGYAADVALLLKMSPTLECQEPGATGRLVEQLKTPAVVVSFAVTSLGGRDKRMRENYERQFLDLAQGRGWQVESLPFERELVFVVAKSPQRGSGG
jgi:16S rRNA (guanine(1405)-N(7))-methyltransferase